MIAHWYVYATIGLIAVLLSWICEKFQIIKSKPLRLFIIIFVSAMIGWCIFDLIPGTE